jgi:trans-aconitate methyltransferase
VSSVFSHPDAWLEPWLKHLQAQVQAEVLELGCGPGHDTAFLFRHGFTRILASDIDTMSLVQTAVRVPRAAVRRLDLAQSLPFSGPRFGMVVASLSLHYFDWPHTLRLARQIHDCLLPGGLLAVRVNSTVDAHYGAVGHREIAPHFYNVNGKNKRFFTEEDVRAVFATHWEFVVLQARTIARYRKPKSVWEALLRKPMPADAPLA